MLDRMIVVQDLNARRRMLARFLPDPVRAIGDHDQLATLTPAMHISQRAPSTTKLGRLGQRRIISRPLDTGVTAFVDYPDLDFPPLFVHEHEHTVHGGMKTGDTAIR